MEFEVWADRDAKRNVRQNQRIRTAPVFPLISSDHWQSGSWQREQFPHHVWHSRGTKAGTKLFSLQNHTLMNLKRGKKRKVILTISFDNLKKVSPILERKISKLTWWNQPGDADSREAQELLSYFWPKKNKSENLNNLDHFKPTIEIWKWLQLV